MNASPPRILSIAGSDCSGGAGIQADIKTITMLGGYAMTAITAITAQDTTGVRAIQLLPCDMLLDQVAACVEDIGVDAVKIGMIGSAEIAGCIADALAAAPEIAAQPGHDRFPIVLDPVLVATSGALLGDRAMIDAMIARLFPLATLLTPNLPELAALTGTDPSTLDEVREAALSLAQRHGFHVLAKGGHSEGHTIIDLLVDPDGKSLSFEGSRIETTHTHGTGCTLSSAIATFLGRGLALPEAIDRARGFVRSALRAAPGFGLGCGPLGHAQARG